MATKEELERQKLAIEVRKLEAETRQAELSALIPDLSKVVVPELKSHEGEAIGRSMATFGALDEVADKIGYSVAQHKPRCVLVTTEPDLATGDLTYRDVEFGLAALSRAAKALLAALQRKDPDEREIGVASALPLLVSAAASVLPQAISLLLPKRSVAASIATVDDLAASAEVCSSLLAHGIAVHHADFQMVPESGIYQRATALFEDRAALIEKKGDLDDDHELHSSIDSVTTAIDGYLSLIRTAAADTKRSPLATAAIFERLHPRRGSPEGSDAAGGLATANAGGTSPTAVSHVLLIKSQAGSTVEHREDRFIADDKFTTITDVHVSFLLLRTDDRRLIDAGISSATAVVSGNIGAVPRIAVIRSSQNTVGVRSDERLVWKDSEQRAGGGSRPDGNASTRSGAAAKLR
jgi:hypothetical protein